MMQWIITYSSRCHKKAKCFSAIRHILIASSVNTNTITKTCLAGVGCIHDRFAAFARYLTRQFNSVLLAQLHAMFNSICLTIYVFPFGGR
jgi:hypothetical protein